LALAGARDVKPRRDEVPLLGNSAWLTRRSVVFHLRAEDRGKSKPMTLVPERVEMLVLARGDEPLEPLARFAPPSLTESAWLAHLDEARARVRGRKSVLRGRWPHLADRVLPALGLGVAADDTKTHARLAGRDAWAAAIVARSLGLWTDGAPPTLPALCDALAWRELALPGKPKRCPPEVRAVFVQRTLGSEAGPPERLVRVLAAREVGAPRPDLSALREALVRWWLAGKTLGPRPFADDVRDVAGTARDGVFGDRKVFIAAVWHELRRQTAWSALSLDEFKTRLVAAHRAGDLRLARADLVAAMDPELVAASEISADGASFHFILREVS
jgi:hypothetical protein